MTSVFDSPTYKRIRKAYVTQCTEEHLLHLLLVDAFLVKLLSHLGLGDAMIGIISSFASFAFIFELLSLFLLRTKISTKKIVVTADVLSQVLFMLLYFIPFLPLDETVRKLLVMAFIMIAYVGKNAVLSLYFKWANAYVEDNKRAIFSARKEIISLAAGIVFSAVMGYAIDKYESIGNIKGGFLFIAISMLALNIINFITLMMIKDEDAGERSSMRVSMGEVFHHIGTNKLFLRYMLISLLMSFAGGLINGFVGVYKVNDLLMSVLLIQIINIAGDFFRMIVSEPIARYSTTRGFAKGIQLAGYLTIIAFALIVFTTRTTWWLIIIYTFVFKAAAAGSSQNSFNISYTLLPTKYMTQAMAVNRTMVGLITFVGALIGGRVVGAVQANGNMVFGIHIYAQQILALFAIIIYIVYLLLNQNLVIKPLEYMGGRVIFDKED